MNKKQPKILIGFPCMSTIPTYTAMSLIKARKPAGAKFSIVQNSLIHYARNEIAATAISDGYDAVVWIDSDMTFEQDAIMRLVEDMYGPESNRATKPIHDYVAGLFFKRRIPPSPVVYQDIEYVADGPRTKCTLHPMMEYPQDRLFRCFGTGFGFVITSTALLKRVWEAFGPPFDPMPMLGEDLSFCKRCQQLGERMWCDSAIKIGHVGMAIHDENLYAIMTGRTAYLKPQGGDNP